MVIAVDGPAGSGKSTVAQRVARELGYRYIDTGAMYRAMAWRVLQVGGEVSDAARVVSIVEHTELEVFPLQEGMGVRINGRDVTREIRTEAISAATSAIAVIPGVRRHLIRLYRQLGAGGGAVLEGRDIGTAAFPDAGLKVYLTASVKTRAQRRLIQQGEESSAEGLERLEDAIRRRDERDQGRQHDPLMRAADAVEIDTTGMSIEEVCRQIVTLARQRAVRPAETKSL